MITTQTLFFALLGGILPALLWLWFWLKEDRHPEPRSLIFLTFVVGMILVPLVIPPQKYVMGYLSGTTLIIVWASIEELIKYFGAHITVLRRRAMNEPIDAMIYMITIALGFSALENTLFLLNPLADGSIIESILTGNLRFFGATLLHVLSSATIGVAMALSFYKSNRAKRHFLWIGIILAITLHALFNLFIINSNGDKILFIFLGVWLGILVLILFFEKIKRIKKPNFRFIKRKR
ncbi:MAG: PrsW family intramembrane metalloprotease [Parcubacteria group bacterium]|nr:PrsW family intramembrane metalloprotease [Parcubacteria group bacterium]